MPYRMRDATDCATPMRQRRGEHRHRREAPLGVLRAADPTRQERPAEEQHPEVNRQHEVEHPARAVEEHAAHAVEVAGRLRVRSPRA